MPKPAHEMDFDEIAEALAVAQPESIAHGRLIAELTRRQTIAQLEATIAQKQAAEAQERAAKWTVWAVVCAAISAFLSLASIILSVLTSSKDAGAWE
jgi:hypothetical protein